MTFIPKALLLSLALLLSINLSAQTLKPVVNVKKSVKQISENQFQLILDVEIDENWKLYVAPGNGEGPVVFSSKVEKNRNLEMLSTFEMVNKPTTKFDEVFNMNVSYLEGKGVFTQMVKLQNPRKSGKIDIVIEYMTCNGTRCLAPVYQIISYNINDFKSEMNSSRIKIPSDLFNDEF